jgi:diguanylate cyclase
MKIAPIPANEAERLAALRNLNVLDTGPELEFYALVHVASLVCQVPVSLISLVDDERQWFKANIGLPGASETPRDIAFCSHAILDDALFEVPDATQDSRFFDNPLVTNAPDIRFYAGAPIRLSDGNRVGTLCVIDREPRHLTDTQRSILRYLAAASAAALEGRRAIQLQDQFLQDLRESEGRFRTLSESSPFGVYYANAQGEYSYTNHQWQQIYGRGLAASLGHLWMDAVHPEDRDHVVDCWRNTVTNGREFSLEFRVVREDASSRRVHSRARPILDDGGQITSFVGAIEDVTEHYQMLERLAANELAIQHEKQRLENILQGTNAATWEWNVQTGEMRFNERWAEIIGYTLNELAPLSIQTWINHVNPDDLANSEAQLGKHFAGEANFYECEVRMLHRDDYFVWVLARGSVLNVDYGWQA